MRSLIYLISGEPQNFDDCRERFRKGHSVKGISLELIKGNEEFCGEILKIPLYGNFRWIFEDRKVEYSEEFGGIVSPYDVGSENLRIEIMQTKDLKTP